MPLYEYHCRDCQREFEKIVSFSEASRSPICPHCHSAHTQKKISKVASFNPSTSSAFNTSTSSCGSSGGFS